MKRSKGFREVNEVTCGGNALKFYATVRLRTSIKELLHSQDEITGIGICIEIMKNKLAPALKKVDLEIEFGRGFRHEAEILAMALDHRVIPRQGDGFWIEGKFFQNMLEAEMYLAGNHNVMEELLNNLRNQLFEDKYIGDSAE